MRVGAYIDGLNLYHGGRQLCGRGQPGWRWLDLRQLCERLLAERRDWGDRGPVLDRVVYCTAFVDGQINEASRNGDLRLPLQLARQTAPVGTVNPSNSATAGDLHGRRDEGAGSHWWRKLTAEDLRSCQMPEVVGDCRRPEGW